MCGENKEIECDEFKQTFFIDELNRKVGKEIIVYKKEDKVIENSYYYGELHGYCFVKNKENNILLQHRYWHGYLCDDKERFRKLIAEFRLDLKNKKYKF